MRLNIRKTLSNVKKLFENGKLVIRGRKSKNDRQYNGQMKKQQKDKNNDLHNTTQKA